MNYWFGYGGMFGSTLGLLSGLQHLSNEELRTGRRIVKMAKSGLAEVHLQVF